MTQELRGRITFIDDEAQICAAAADWLEASGFDVATYTNPVEALAQLDTAACDCVVTDLRMPGMSGHEVLESLRLRDPDLPIVLLSGHADVPAAVATMRVGAHDFLEKPYRAEHLVEVLEGAVSLRRLRRGGGSPGSALATERLEARLTGTSAAIRHLRAMVMAVADLPLDLLITGPDGSGRRTLARCVHDFGRRARRPFVSMDCQMLNAPGAEITLLGHERGNLPGAAARAGLLEQAHGGTLYLGDIDLLPTHLQAHLMTIIHSGEVTRVGGVPRPVDVRVIASISNAASDKLRPELFYHLSPGILAVPPLSERREDIPILFSAFIQEAARRFGRPIPEMRMSELDRIMAQAWSGNLPELRAEAIRRVLNLHLAPNPAPPLSLPDRMAQIEAQIISDTLDSVDGASARAAEILGIPRRTLNEKITRYSLRAD